MYFNIYITIIQVILTIADNNDIIHSERIGKQENKKMENQFERTELLLGENAVSKLKKSCVAVFGVGGVGGYTVEALVRSGVGEIDVIDNDTVSLSNINRQIIALHSTVGQSKVEVIKQRALDINPDVKINCHEVFFMPDTANQFDFTKYDYVADAIDTVTGKIEIIMQSQNAGVKVISSMGAGNKLDPTRFEVEDIYKTSVCPLARVMRRELKNRGVKKLKVVYSKEEAIKPSVVTDGKAVPGSLAFVPSVAGLVMAGEIIKDLIED